MKGRIKQKACKNLRFIVFCEVRKEKKGMEYIEDFFLYLYIQGVHKLRNKIIFQKRTNYTAAALKILLNLLSIHIATIEKARVVQLSLESSTCYNRSRKTKILEQVCGKKNIKQVLRPYNTKVKIKLIYLASVRRESCLSCLIGQTSYTLQLFSEISDSNEYWQSESTLYYPVQTIIFNFYGPPSVSILLTYATDGFFNISSL